MSHLPRAHHHEYDESCSKLPYLVVIVKPPREFGAIMLRILDNANYSSNLLGCSILLAT